MANRYLIASGAGNNAAIYDGGVATPADGDNLDLKGYTLSPCARCGLAAGSKLNILNSSVIGAKWKLTGASDVIAMTEFRHNTYVTAEADGGGSIANRQVVELYGTWNGVDYSPFGTRPIDMRGTIDDDVSLADIEIRAMSAANSRMYSNVLTGYLDKVCFTSFRYTTSLYPIQYLLQNMSDGSIITCSFGKILFDCSAFAAGYFFSYNIGAIT